MTLTSYIEMLSAVINLRPRGKLLEGGKVDWKSILVVPGPRRVLTRHEISLSGIINLTSNSYTSSPYLSISHLILQNTSYFMKVS